MGSLNTYCLFIIRLNGELSLHTARDKHIALVITPSLQLNFSINNSQVKVRNEFLTFHFLVLMYSPFAYIIYCRTENANLMIILLFLQTIPTSLRQDEF